jgi:adenylosuccinate synthase
VRRIVNMKCATLKAQFASDGGLSADAVLGDLAKARERLGAWIGDTTEFLNESIESGKRLLFEGANGVLLDVDHGTYPFVTSSSTGPHGIGPGAGIPESHVGCRIGVAKAYSTRVGSGPFVSELSDATGDLIRERGHEYGTTTGRPRRCGWFDAVAARYSGMVSGATDLALLHLDTLSGFERIGICTAYEWNGYRARTMPAAGSTLEKAQPVFEYMPGWTEELAGVRRFEDLPQNARNYVDRIEALVGVPASILGVGPERSQTILRGGSAGLDRVWRQLETLQVTP